MRQEQLESSQSTNAYCSPKPLRISLWPTYIRLQSREKMFALVPSNSVIISVILKCDPCKADLLRQQYAAVRASNFHRKRWSNILLAGSVPLLLVH